MPLTRSQIRRQSENTDGDKDGGSDVKPKTSERKSGKRKKAQKVDGGDGADNKTGSEIENDGGASRDEEGKDKAKKKIRARRSSTSRELSDLLRTREGEVLQSSRESATETTSNPKFLVVGIDEAGRGPLAGPVVAAAVTLLDPVAEIPVRGITDSKKITNPLRREELFEAMRAVGPGRLRWAAAVVDAARIDEINILQASLEAMTLACTALTCPSKLVVPSYSTVSADVKGSYVVQPKNEETKHETSERNISYFALVDGNRLPSNFPEPVVGAQAMISGDSREYCIASASIVAKVLRDQLMDLYHHKYCPGENDGYQWDTNRGYPTAAHVDAIHRLGRVSPIHRLTFAPLKHMQFDDERKIIKRGKK